MGVIIIKGSCIFRLKLTASILFLLLLLNTHFAFGAGTESEKQLIERLNGYVDLLNYSVTKYPYQKIKEFLKDATIKQGVGEGWHYTETIEKGSLYQIVFETVKNENSDSYLFNRFQFKSEKFDVAARDKELKRFLDTFSEKYGKPRLSKKYENGGIKIAWWLHEDDDSKRSLSVKSSGSSDKKGNIRITMLRVSKSDYEEDH